MDDTGFLHRYFLSNGHKPLHKWLHYFDIYERHFARFRGRSPTMLEIGVSGGGSLAMWREYFGPTSTILGLDIDPACVNHGVPGGKVYVGSQDDRNLLNRIVEENPCIDIVLDDGSHHMQHIIATFNALYEHVQPSGVYVVEDTHTCYWPEYGAGVKAEDSFMEFVKERIDDLNAMHTRGALPVSDFCLSTSSVCCYDSIVVFERQRQGTRQAPVTGPVR